MGLGFTRRGIRYIEYSSMDIAFLDSGNFLPTLRLVAKEVPGCESEAKLDWSLVYQAARDLKNEQLSHVVWRMMQSPAVDIAFMLGSSCRGGAQWVAMTKLSFCDPVSTSCHVYQ